MWAYRSIKVIVCTLVLVACSVSFIRFFSGSAFAVCNDVCRAKCNANWRKNFTSEQHCIAVWSVRNGPSGQGCGTPSGPFESCASKQRIPARPNTPLPLPVDKASPEHSEVRTNSAVAFVPPPRTIADITAILDSEKPDPKKIDERRARADAKPPIGLPPLQLARFYYDRGNVRNELGRLAEGLEDANRAIEMGRGTADAGAMALYLQLAAAQHAMSGNPKKALSIYFEILRYADVQGAKGWRFNGCRQAAFYSIQLGNLAQAETYLRRAVEYLEEARTSGHPRWRENYAKYGHGWEAEVEQTRGDIAEAHGRFREAEAAFRLAELHRRAAMPGYLNRKDPYHEALISRTVDSAVLSQARMKMEQGRLAEAESDARRALLSRLKDQGKYHPTTPDFIMGLANVLVEQGRYEEAEKLARTALEINREVGVAEDSQTNARLLANLASILDYQGKQEQAIAVHASLDRTIANWEPQRRQGFEFSRSRINALYAAGQVETGIATAQRLVARAISRVGEKHFDTAAARGILAVGYMRGGKNADAVREFKAAIPILIAAVHEIADADETTLVAARSGELQLIVEAYIGLLAKTEETSGNAAIETFRLADAIRGQSVQQALTASGARMAAKDAALAELIRNEQDLAKQVNAQLGVLNNALALPSGERDEAGVRAINATIEKARSERTKARAEIARRFPSYADLIDPKAPTVEQIREALRPGEAFVSFYFGREKSFAWAVPKQGPVAFALINTTARDLESKVRKLREALEPRVLRTIKDIPKFDLALAHDLYRLLLEPIEAGWKSANNLIMVTNGALGLLPLSLLPTAPTELTERDEPRFAKYRSVPWLARSHAVTVVPSAAALRTLRQLPPGSDKRQPLIGFGDPYFSLAQAAEDQTQPPRGPLLEVAALPNPDTTLRRRAAVETRQIDTADLARLPRLSDTADELKSIALSLKVDPAKVLHLGRDANERVVKTTDLSRFRIVAFATHGLMPGDLDGLTQPALALSAPSVADVDGDGLLTMEEILALKLDADWVVLSACNTATGAEAGAEAVSGLGRAFFYAGTRALLVTNWAVMSDAATALTTDTFRRQAADPKLARAEALRQAMVGLIDGPGYVYSGKTVYTYAHPLFWAPYSIIGDGGAR
jgi:CHAT domain-containing protein/tetratricopeptide (TPR) repeat protein